MKKIIRNKIPMIAEQNGNRKGMTLKKFKSGNIDELEILFKMKIVEEAKEIFKTCNDIDLKYELVDLIQVIDEFLIMKGITDKEIETLVKSKVYTHGRFVTVKSYAGGSIMDESEVYVLDLEEKLHKWKN